MSTIILTTLHSTPFPNKILFDLSPYLSSVDCSLLLITSSQTVLFCFPISQAENYITKWPPSPTAKLASEWIVWSFSSKQAFTKSFIEMIPTTSPCSTNGKCLISRPNIFAMHASTVSLGAAVTRFATCVDISFTFVVLPCVWWIIIRYKRYQRYEKIRLTISHSLSFPIELSLWRSHVHWLHQRACLYCMNG